MCVRCMRGERGGGSTRTWKRSLTQANTGDESTAQRYTQTAALQCCFEVQQSRLTTAATRMPRSAVLDSAQTTVPLPARPAQPRQPTLLGLVRTQLLLPLQSSAQLSSVSL